MFSVFYVYKVMSSLHVNEYKKTQVYYIFINILYNIVNFGVFNETIKDDCGLTDCYYFSPYAVLFLCDIQQLCKYHASYKC